MDCLVNNTRKNILFLQYAQKLTNYQEKYCLCKKMPIVHFDENTQFLVSKHKI